MITKNAFLTGIDCLQTAFQYKMTEEQFALYYGIISTKIKDGTQFMRVVDLIVVSETRFPAIATFIKYNVEVGITDEQREKNMKAALDGMNE